MAFAVATIVLGGSAAAAAASSPAQKPGSHSTSLLSSTIASAGCAATARLRAVPKPRFSPSSSSVTSGKSARTAADEPSLEPLSTTTTSSRSVWARRLCSVRGNQRSPLKFGM